MNLNKSPAGFILIFLFTFFLLDAAYGQEKVENPHFSLKIPDTWTYVHFSDTPTADQFGSGPGNMIFTTPVQFGNILLENKEGDDTTADEKLQSGAGAYSAFLQDTGYPLKNSPLDAYVKYRIDLLRDIWNVTSMDNGTIANEKATKVSASGINDFTNLKMVEYLVFNDEDPYLLQYIANTKDYDNYLPEFEAMVRSFKFVG